MQSIELRNAMHCMSHRNGIHWKVQYTSLLNLFLYNGSAGNGQLSSGTAKKVVAGNGTDISVSGSSFSTGTSVIAVVPLSHIVILRCKDNVKIIRIFGNKELELGIAGIHTIVQFTLNMHQRILLSAGSFFRVCPVVKTHPIVSGGLD